MRNVKSENTKKEISQKLIAFLKRPHEDEEDEDDSAETTDDSDLVSANQMVNLPAGNDMDENAVLEMMDGLGGNGLPVVNDMDENAALQLLEELGGNELPAVNDMDENAILEMIEELTWWQ
ncbi:hypothetical protein IHE45_10G009500 [Dioscorea alata]|uniref:Uncharacterized protein n=1 Tax=Dioscorea alata TaxID=55571 RepID=A0ACB7V997_DIOAL|nr:hypothetical protein IHE45_10G009500 [Dioscorea alata]